MTVAIIAAAGDGRRWGRSPPRKHLVEVDGERIIERTVRLLRERRVRRVHVVGRTVAYLLNGASLFKPTLVPELAEADKHLNCKQLWNAVWRALALNRAGVIDKVTSFAVYRAMLGLPDEVMGRYLVSMDMISIIDDWTDDFDWRDDYARFLEHRERAYAVLPAP